MRKLLLMMTTIIITSVIPLAALAEKPLTIHGSSIPNPADSPQVMSKDAFKETVTKFSTEATTNLNQTVQSQVKGSGAGTPPAKETPPTNTPAQPQKPAASTDDEDNTAQPTQPANQKPAPSTTPQNNQPYSGFGAGQPSQKSGNTNSSQDSKKSSNWNVGY